MPTVVSLLTDLTSLLGVSEALIKIKTVIDESNTSLFPISMALTEGKWRVNIELQYPGEEPQDIETTHIDLAKALNKALGYIKPPKARSR